MSSMTPMVSPPTKAPGMDPKPPSTAAAKALRPMKPKLISTSDTGARSTPAIAATPAEMAQMSEHMSFTGRSEEHTSELQSRPHLVCRLLLEKKKQRK